MRYRNRVLSQAARAAKLQARVQAAQQRAYAKELRDRERRSVLDYLAAREAEAQDRSLDSQAKIEQTRSILRDVNDRKAPVDFEKLKVKPKYPHFDPKGTDVQEPLPDRQSYLPSPITLWQKLTGRQRQYDELVSRGESEFEEAVQDCRKRNAERAARLDKLRSDYRALCERFDREAEEENAKVDAFKAAYFDHAREAVVDYFTLVFDEEELPLGFPEENRVAYDPDSKQLLIERRLPLLTDLPAEASFKYVKKTDSIEPILRKPAELRSAYSDALAQVTLSALRRALSADVAASFATISVNGYVDTIDPGTGNRTKPTLLSVTTSREALAGISFSNVDASTCLRNLKALVSRNAHELAPVRPLVSFDMVDRRFVDKTDVLSTLDDRPNLAELSPSEFETLMTNLFEKMGLETRLTQASRDGGVDCVAWDMRPVIGGKVIIQAKRYKHTVGVSAVRDLFGTMMNEGAAKGILVTTSGYGPSAYEFAKNKPIELVTGSNLLAMLGDIAHINAKIEFPDEWADAEVDTTR